MNKHCISDYTETHQSIAQTFKWIIDSKGVAGISMTLNLCNFTCQGNYQVCTYASVRNRIDDLNLSSAGGATLRA